MTISVKIHERMAEYTVTQGENKVSVLQFRVSRNMWGEPTVSSIIHIDCKGEPLQMIKSLKQLVREIELVLTVLDRAMIEMGDEYKPPSYPFEDKYVYGPGG